MQVVTLKEKEYYSVKKVPSDPNSFFENFIDIFAAKSFSMGVSLTIDEKGPRENLKTIFQFIGMIGMNLNSTIRFEIESSKLTVFGQPFIEFNIPRAAGKKMITKQIGKTFHPLMAKHIKDAVEEAFNYKNRGAESGTGAADPLKQLKLRFVNGEISEEEYLRKKQILED